MTLVPKNEGSPVSTEGRAPQITLSINDEACEREDKPDERDDSDMSILPSKDTILPAPISESIGGMPKNGASSPDESLGIIAAAMVPITVRGAAVSHDLFEVQHAPEQPVIRHDRDEVSVASSILDESLPKRHSNPVGHLPTDRSAAIPHDIAEVEHPAKQPDIVA